MEYFWRPGSTDDKSAELRIRPWAGAMEEESGLAPLRKRRRDFVVAAKRKRKRPEKREVEERQGEGARRQANGEVESEDVSQGLVTTVPTEAEDQTPCLHAGLEVFNRVLQCTATLGELGCALGWMLARITYRGELEFDKMVMRTVFECCTRPPVASIGGAIFPLPLGALDACEGALRAASLEHVVTPGFVERWQNDAWRLCATVGLNSMRGRLQPLAMSASNKMQTRAAAATLASVQRFLRLGVS